MKAFVLDDHKNKLMRAAALLLTLVICLASLLPLRVSAAESGTCGEGLTWTYDGGKLTISGSGEMTNFFDNNMPPWYGHAREITSVVVQEGVETLGELAFYQCESLVNVVLPNSLREIGIRAFKDCTSLAYLNLPGGLYAIAESAFENCSSLNGIRLDEGLVILGDKAFYRCSSLTNITVPESVNYMGMVIFAYCENLVRAVIRCPIERLPDWTFYACTKLVSVSLPETLKSVGSLSFFDCTHLSGVYYNGDLMNDIYDQITADNPYLSGNGGIVGEEIGDSYGVVSENSSGDTATYTDVKETENSIITVEEEVSLEQNEDGTFTSTVVDDTISVTVVNEEGWEEITEVIDEMIEQREEGQSNGSVSESSELVVNIQIPDDSVPTPFLEQYAGKEVIINLTTSDGSSWQIDMRDVTEDQFAGMTALNLAYTLVDVEKEIDGVNGTKVFEIKFEQDVDFNIKASVKLGLDYARRYATLYQKNGSSAESVENVWIDAYGNAWFYLASIDKGTDYYIGIDAEGVSRSNSIIPSTMAGELGEYQGLMDSEGNLYKLTGRTSRWGITGGQFALYAAVVLGFIVLVVAVIMITRNHMQKSRRAVAAPAGPAPVKDDDLRDKIMREMLEESKAREKAKGKDAGKGK